MLHGRHRISCGVPGTSGVQTVPFFALVRFCDIRVDRLGLLRTSCRVDLLPHLLLNDRLREASLLVRASCFDPWASASRVAGTLILLTQGADQGLPLCSSAPSDRDCLPAREHSDHDLPLTCVLFLKLAAQHSSFHRQSFGVSSGYMGQLLGYFRQTSQLSQRNLQIERRCRTVR